jgi:O-Antigen ligase
VLIRPVIDNFYYLKEVSPFLSPLYIVGVLTPLLAIWTISRYNKPNYSRLDTFIGIYSVLILLSCTFLLIRDTFSFDAIEYTLKLSFPVYVYYFSRRLIRSKEDLHGLLQTFLYSAMVVGGIFLYELIFNPINVVYSRGMERFQGSYADSMNYAVYMTCSMLIVCYAFLAKADSYSFNKRVIPLAIVIVISTLMLFNINHTASYAVVFAILLLFLLHSLRANIGVGIIFTCATLGIIYTFGYETIDEKIKPLIETDIQVVEGEKGNEALFHGRVGRWQNFLGVFFEQSTPVQFIGLPSGMDKPYMYISKGSHNDFVRTLLFTGFLGLIIYLVILGNLFFRIIKYSTPGHFMGLAALAILVLYSISTTPLLYQPMMYVLFPIFCIYALPLHVLEQKAGR